MVDSFAPQSQATKDEIQRINNSVAKFGPAYYDAVLGQGTSKEIKKAVQEGRDLATPPSLEDEVLFKSPVQDLGLMPDPYPVNVLKGVKR